VKRKSWLQLSNIDVIRNNRYILQNISLELYEGEIITLLGPNGSGKSTLIGLINRTFYPIIKPGYNLKIFGKELINIWDLRKKISVVNDDLNNRINQNMSTQEVIISGLYGTIGISEKQKLDNCEQSITRKIVKEFDLEKILKKKYKQLSDGQQRNVLIARAMINRPKILILDEPTINLDIKALFNLYKILSKLVRSKVTILYITNKIDSILKETDRIILIKSGKIIADGIPEKIMNSETISNLYDTNLELINFQGNWRAIPKLF
tara:strand:- start:1144 stop:1938 length:795 start_codon:yes stop_codon:yes gene_type:complete